MAIAWRWPVAGLYLADALAAAFVVPHPAGYRALHPGLVLRLDRAGFGYLLRPHVLDACRAAARRRD